ncbi:transmembrane protein 272-like [Embiotoca jacksoni]|uniref:transmembrane protein 272-like n=1 Tax=Embiotoca jacksoni TaxID=100190 RepID=UPI0037047995
MNPSLQMEPRPQRATLIATIVVVNMIWWIVMIAAIGLGITHLGSCPLHPYIPIYLVVLGASSILALCMTYTMSMFKDGSVYILSTVCMTCLHIFSFCWFIAGTSWIYSVYPPNYSKDGPNLYCQRTTYQFAFVITTLVWVTLAVLVLFGCCFALLTCCMTVVATRHLIPGRNSFYGATSDYGDV